MGNGHKYDKLSLEEKLVYRGWTVTESGCWETNCSRGSRGYGQIQHAGVRYSTHRAAYEVWVGPIPDGYYICHRCDNRPCINPDHLFAGTALDNVRDMISKGREYHPRIRENGRFGHG